MWIVKDWVQLFLPGANFAVSFNAQLAVLLLDVMFQTDRITKGFVINHPGFGDRFKFCSTGSVSG